MNFVIYKWYDDFKKSSLPNMCYAISSEQIIEPEMIFEFENENYYITENGNICFCKDYTYVESASLIQRMINKKENISIVKNMIDNSKYDYGKF